MLLESLRQEICRYHAELPRNNLVSWTSGNVSGRDPASGWVVIKPSGIPYSELTPENMVVVDLEGRVIEGQLKPSSDTFAHVYVYRHRNEINGVVHTHSTYATAWAAVGQSR
jgi:L-ribulose-5-phosphate 4-epimerase